MREEILQRKLDLLWVEPSINKALRFLDACRSSSGGYAARIPGDKPSVATTAMVCIARKKAGVITEPIDSKTREDVNFLFSKFNDASKSWSIFRGEIPSTWSTALCIWALSIMGEGSDPRVSAAIDTLLSLQDRGGWGITREDSNEILISYVAARSLIAYYVNMRQDLRIKNALESSAEYFKHNLDERIDDLNITDCALALQGLDDICLFGITDHSSLDRWRNQAITHLHDLISEKKYLDNTNIFRRVGSGEWHIYHFHPAALSIIKRHNSDDLDTYELLNWFASNFKTDGDNQVKWDHFSESASTYTTALAVYALCDLFSHISMLDYFKIMRSNDVRIRAENANLRNLHARLTPLLMLWRAVWNNTLVQVISNYSGAISAVVGTGLLGILWFYWSNITQVLMDIINKFLNI